MGLLLNNKSPSFKCVMSFDQCQSIYNFTPWYCVGFLVRCNALYWWRRWCWPLCTVQLPRYLQHSCQSCTTVFWVRFWIWIHLFEKRHARVRLLFLSLIVSIYVVFHVYSLTACHTYYVKLTPHISNLCVLQCLSHVCYCYIFEKNRIPMSCHHIYMYTYMRMYMDIYVHMYICIRIYVYLYTHTYTYCTFLLLSWQHIVNI